MTRWISIVASFALVVCAMLYSGPVGAKTEADPKAACEFGGSAYVYLHSSTSPSGPPSTCTPSLLGSWDCSVDMQGVVRWVHVHVLAVPFQRVRFSLPNPPTGGVAGEEWFFPYSGDRVNGIEIDLGNCSEGGDVCVGALLVFTGTPPTCQPWQIDVGCQVLDCNGAWQDAWALPHHMSPGPFACGCDGCFQCCAALRPWDLLPADRATEVPHDVELSWTSPVYDSPFGEPSTCGVRIGTDPDCQSGETFYIPCGDSPSKAYTPDFLQPGTTYYWQALGYFHYCGGGGSPIQSFTTAGPLAAEQATWGRVKAMYRD